jgi:hypothetical protein
MRFSSGPAFDLRRRILPAAFVFYRGEGMEDSRMPSTLAARLADALRHQQAYLAIYRHYRDARPREDFAALLAVLCDDAQEASEGLARALRHAGESPLAVEPPPRLLEQGLRRRGTLSRLQFILVGMQNNIAYYQAQLAYPDEDDVRGLWAELLATAQQRLTQIKGLIRALEHRAAQEERPTQ